MDKTDKFDLLIKYLWYRIKAKSEHGIHSPFLFELYNDVFVDSIPFYAFEEIESIRAKLLLSRNKIMVYDYGAGQSAEKKNHVYLDMDEDTLRYAFPSKPRVYNHGKRRVSTIAKRSLKPPKYGQLLFRLVHRFQPKTILELGTSLGITTLYLAKPNNKAEVVTIEGCPNISKIAQINFEKLGATNIKLVNKRFEEGLHNYLDSINELDFAFFDGNHTKEATLRYFNWSLEKRTNESIFIFDDINWSTEMNEAWQEIKKHPEVTTTVDLFAMGIVFFNTSLSKENFILKY